MDITKNLQSLFKGILVLLIVFGFSSGISNAQYPTSGSSAKSLGKVTLGTNVSEWEVGSGQFNGEFVVAEQHGIELGLRIQERFVGPIDVTGDNGNRVGVYHAITGDTGGNNATWNYDWHVDLSDARGKAKGKVLADYRLFLEQDFSEENLFETLGTNPVELPLEPGVCSPGTFDAGSLCQQSWNPGFGNDDFDPNTEGTYNLRLVLVPETFNGPPVAVSVKVVVSDQKS